MATKPKPPGGGGVEGFDDALLSPSKSTPSPTAVIDQGLSVATLAPDFAPPAEIRELLDKTLPSSQRQARAFFLPRRPYMLPSDALTTCPRWQPTRQKLQPPSSRTFRTASAVAIRH